MRDPLPRSEEGARFATAAGALPDDTITIEIRGESRTMTLALAIELAQALNAAVARHVNQRVLALVAKEDS